MDSLLDRLFLLHFLSNLLLDNKSAIKDWLLHLLILCEHAWVIAWTNYHVFSMWESRKPKTIMSAIIEKAEPNLK